jgi:hypothetical protein
MQRLGAGGPLQAGVVCLLRRDSMTAIDPVTGRKLWVRTDITSRSHIFGDSQNVYVVALDQSGKAAGTKALRAYDGATLKTVKDFSPEFDSRKRLMGGIIMGSTSNARNEPTLSLYDVLAGKMAWTETFPANSIVLDSQDPDLAGVVVPSTGEVKVVSLKTRKPVLTTKLRDPADFKKAQVGATGHATGAESVALVTDQDFFFLVIKQPTNPNDVNGMVMPAFQSGYGLRGVPVNGQLYAFRRADQKLQWFNLVQNTYLVLSGSEDHPALHFCAYYQKWLGAPGGPRSLQQTWTALSLAKHNGKRWYGSDESPIRMNTYFTGFTVDHRTGKMEMLATTMKVTMWSEAVKK